MNHKRLLYILMVCSITGIANSQDLGSIKSQDPFKISGGLSLSSTFYGVNGIENRRSPFSYSIAASPVISLYGITFPFSFLYSNEQSSFSQPFNQYGVSPYYKWLKFHFGYRNVNFSPYTLAGHTFLGVGVEANPGLLRFGAVYGRFKEAIEEDTISGIDTNLYQMPIPSYKRMGYAFKIGIGNDKNYFDIIYFKATDDTNSIPYKPVKYELEPGENAVIGLSNKTTLLKSLTWKTDIGFSLYTRNTSLEEFEDPQLQAIDLLKSVITPNVSTQMLLAGETSLLFKQKTYSLQARYKRIDPDYQTMGAYYFQNDIEQYTFIPTFILFKNKVIFNGSIGYQKDNLYAKKALRTGRTIGSGNIVLNPSQKFGLTLQYSNYGFSQKSTGLIENYSDSLTIKQVSQNISVMPRFTFINEKSSQVLYFNVSYQEVRNKNVLNNMVQDMTSVVSSVSYSYFSLTSSFSFTPSVFYNYNKVQTGVLRSLGLSMNFGKPFFENRLQNSLMFSYNTNSFDGSNNGNTVNINATVQWAMTKNLKHHMNFSFSWIHNNTKNNISSEFAETRSFSETIGTIGYNYSF